MTSSTFDKGMEIRKAVLGDAHVDASFDDASDFSRPLQELVTEFCFGAVWGREGLSRRSQWKNPHCVYPPVYMSDSDASPPSPRHVRARSCSQLQTWWPPMVSAQVRPRDQSASASTSWYRRRRAPTDGRALAASPCGREAAGFSQASAAASTAHERNEERDMGARRRW